MEPTLPNHKENLEDLHNQLKSTQDMIKRMIKSHWENPEVLREIERNMARHFSGLKELERATDHLRTASTFLIG